MSSTNASAILFDNDVWIEAVLYLPGIAAIPEYGPFPDKFEDDFIGEVFERETHQVLRAFPALKVLFKENEHPSPSAVAEVLAREQPRAGFFIQVATPQRRYAPGRESWTSGSTHYLSWFYAGSEGSFVSLAVDWAETRHAADKAKAA